MTPKQEKFCVEYLIDLNGTQAAIRSGYSAKTADRIANQNLRKLEIQNRIEELRKKEFKKRIMAAEEIEALLADIARGETSEEVVVTVATGDYCTDVRIVDKKVSEKDRLKALELLAKRNQLLTERVHVTEEAVPVIVDDIADG